MPFVVIYDANVLYPSTLRDLLIRVAQAGLVQARWTHQILDETFDSIKKNRPELPATALGRTRELMICAIRDCLVTDYEPLIEILDFPDPDEKRNLCLPELKRRRLWLPSFACHLLFWWSVATTQRGRDSTSGKSFM